MNKFKVEKTMNLSKSDNKLLTETENLLRDLRDQMKNQNFSNRFFKTQKMISKRLKSVCDTSLESRLVSHTFFSLLLTVI